MDAAGGHSFETIVTLVAESKRARLQERNDVMMPFGIAPRVHFLNAIFYNCLAGFSTGYNFEERILDWQYFSQVRNQTRRVTIQSHPCLRFLYLQPADILSSDSIVAVVNPSAIGFGQGSHWVCVVLNLPTPKHTSPDVVYYDSFKVRAFFQDR